VVATGLASTRSIAFTKLAAQNTEIDIVLQTRSKAHIDEVEDKLRAVGMQVDLA